MQIYLSCLCFVLLCHCYSARLSRAATQVILTDTNGQPVKQYVAVFYIDNGRVLVEPQLRASIVGSSDVALICGFRLSEGRWPVDVRLHDPATGTGQLFARHGAVGSNASLGFFNFNVTAFDCDRPAHESTPVPVSLRSEKFALPTFDLPTYSVAVPHDIAIGAELIRVRATQPTVGICRYGVQGGDGAFDIDGAGIVRARSSLLPAKGRRLQLLLTATDCDVPQPRSATATLAIDVVERRNTRETCVTEWKGLPSSVNYRVADSELFFAKEAELPDCRASRMTCVQTEATMRIGVGASQIGQCDLDEAALSQQRRLCGINSDSLNLLSVGGTSSSDAYASVCQSDGVVNFDKSTNPIEIEHTAARHLGQNFSLHFWLKHNKMPDNSKEQILCSSDTTVKHNRHHYSVFLHNCKLVLLIRRETGPREAFRPAEWRFRAKEVCDNRWHHYGLLRNGQRARLLIDGVEYNGEPTVLEDRPMHSPGGTQTTIGACWHAAEGRYRQALRGQLAGVTLLPRAVEQSATVACLSSCRPSLSLRSIRRLPLGSSVSLSADYSVVEASASNSSVLAKLLGRIGVLASGVSKGVELTIETEIRCNDSQMAVSIPVARISASLLPPRRLCLSGRGLRQASAAALSSPGGVVLLPDLDIESSEALKACSLRTAPELTAVEYISWPAARGAEFKIEGRLSSRTQLLLDGEASAGQYLQLLRAIRYRNVSPVIAYRTFVLSCSIGSLNSNQLVVKLGVLGESNAWQQTVAKAAEAKKEQEETKMNAAVGQATQGLSELHRQHQSEAIGGHFAKSHAMVLPASAHGVKGADNSGLWAAAPALIGVLTIGLVVTVLSLAIYRLRCRGSQQQKQHQPKVHCRPGKTLPIDAESQEMEWDNAGLSITVNPLDEETDQQPLLKDSN